MRSTLLLILCFTAVGCCPHGTPESEGRDVAALFPSYPPITDAAPRIREKRVFQVPTRLLVEQTADRIAVSVDPDSLEQIELEVGHKMVAGFKFQQFVVFEGTIKLCREGLVSGDTANMSTSFYGRGTDSIPQRGKNFVIEVKVITFETDIPAQHEWLPESGRYKELWSRTLRSEEL